MKYVVFLSLLLFACSEKKPTPPPPPIPVKTIDVVKKEAPLYIDAIGHVEPMISVNIVSRVKGELTGVYFKEGETVKKGDLLFTVDPRDYQTSLDKAKAGLEQNLASLRFAQEKVTRYTNLTKEEYFSQIDFDQFKTDTETLQAAAKQNKADIDYAELQLSYCWIYSPLDGRTGILQIDQGNMLKEDESQTLVTVNQMAPIYTTLSIPEKELPRLWQYKSEGKFEVRASYGDFTHYFTGYLEMVDNTVDMKTGMVKLRAVFANTHEELWPGQFVRTRVILTVLKDSIVIPYAAIDMTSKGIYVYVVKKDKTVEMRAVKLGQREEEEVIILEGLSEGETIVTEGLFNLYPGAAIEVKS